VVLPVDSFSANGEQCLNRLCQPRGQAHRVIHVQDYRLPLRDSRPTRITKHNARFARSLSPQEFQQRVRRGAYECPGVAGPHTLTCLRLTYGPVYRAFWLVRSSGQSLSKKNTPGVRP
jgi:hypothetical protein